MRVFIKSEVPRGTWNETGKVSDSEEAWKSIGRDLEKAWKS